MEKSSPPLLSPRELVELAPLAAPFFSAEDVRDMAASWSEHVGEFGPAKALPVFERAFAAIEAQLSALPECTPEALTRLRSFHRAVLARIAQRVQ